MPYSYDTFDGLIRSFLTSHIPLSANILDVGPGEGKYSRLLPEYTLDCIEIFEPYIDQFQLRSKYRHVHTGHIADFPFDQHTYDYVLMGDVLEHLSLHEAKKCLQGAKTMNARVFVAVPYRYEQGEAFGNIYEMHLQPDLTPDVMSKRYPELKLLHRDDTYGLYTGFDNWMGVLP